MATSLIKYGRLYNYASASGGTILTGMSIPSQLDWQTLVDYIDGTYNMAVLTPHVRVGGVWKQCSNVWVKVDGVWKNNVSVLGKSPTPVEVGNRLKHPRKNGTPVLSSEYNTSVHPRWDANNTHYGRDTVNFGGLPAGYYNTWLGQWMMAWSSTEFDGHSNYSFTLRHSTGAAGTQGYTGKAIKISVRLVRSATSSEQSNFSDGATIEQVSDYDGNVYDLIRIGTQVFNKQNIASLRYSNGTSISNVSDPQDNSDLVFFSSASESIW